MDLGTLGNTPASIRSPFPARLHYNMFRETIYKKNLDGTMQCFTTLIQGEWLGMMWLELVSGSVPNTFLLYM